MGNIYNKLFAHKFFNKIFIIYSLVTIFAIIIIAYITSLNINFSLEKRETENNRKILTDINGYFIGKIATSRNIAENIYTSSSLYSEISYLMNNGYNKHLQYKYDKLLSSPDNKFYGFENYFNSCLNMDRDLRGICIYSNRQSDAFVYSNTGRTIYNKDLNITKHLSTFPKSHQGMMMVPAHQAHYYNGDGNSLVFTIAYQLKDNFSSDLLGYLAIDYSLEGITDVLNKYSSDYKGTVLIFTNQGETIFDSSGKYYSSNYPYFDILNSLKKDSDFYDKNIVNTLTSVDSGTLTAAILQKQLILKGEASMKKRILLISFACIAATLFLTFITMLTFSKRSNSLITGIRNINSGDLSSRISVKNKYDEISDIANSFNIMCDNLNNYIEKVYISDIRQKQAQLKALQAQINPHFLYNTLESIRMRALVDGSKDVAEMIYLLSSLFRSTIREKTIVGINEEIKHCKNYLDLFNMRFMDNIKVVFDVKEDVLNYAIIKHAIQPLIENYIIHGVDTQRSDNQLTIRIFKNDNDIFIYVIDNGSGIGEEKLHTIRQTLITPDLPGSSGLGLSNVNERIKLLFGNKYGIDIYSEYSKGTVVLLRIPAMTREELESLVQGNNS